MQFNVPQFVEVEDKIFGPLTLKQFFMFLGGTIVIIFLWYLFALWVVIVVAIPIVAFLVASVFVKVNGRSFMSFFSSWLKYLFNTKTFVWKRKV